MEIGCDGECVTKTMQTRMVNFLTDCSICWDLIIILAGTNDIGSMFNEQKIWESIHKLHQTCRDSFKIHTMAITIPEIKYKHSTIEKRKDFINQNILQHYGRSKHS